MALLFTEFHAGTLNLDGLNRALLVLLLKKKGVRCAPPMHSDPSLCKIGLPMKLFSKAMINRLASAM